MSVARVVPIVVLLAVACGIAWFVLRGDDAEANGWVASGVVEAVEADLGFQAGGRVAAVLVREGDVVSDGQLLARLDVNELEARRDVAEAQLMIAAAQLAELEAGARPEELASARAAVSAATERLGAARREVERLRPLVAAGAVAEQVFDRATTAAQVAQAQHEQAVEALRLLERGTRAERVRVQRAVGQQAAASVAQVDAALANAVMHAPFAGLVTIRHREPGESVSPGLPVVTVMDPANRWVRIYVPEPRVASLSLGAQAEIRTDGSTESFAGRVIHIASEAEFTPRNVQTPEERVKLVYAVRVAVVGDPGRVLKPGLPADVRFPDSASGLPAGDATRDRPAPDSPSDDP